MLRNAQVNEMGWLKFAILAAIFVGCSSAGKNATEDNGLLEAMASAEEGSSIDVDEEVDEILPAVPTAHNEHVEKWIKYFTETDRERFQRFLDRGGHYRDVVENILRENGVPTELYYLAMIESGFQTKATSRASAVGVWQFIDGTGRRYGLQSNWYIDERRDPIRATEAAAKYLKDLYRAFNSWYLAMAAYNAGEHRVLGAVMRGKTRDFWKLVDKKMLPNETMNYVPKFLAALAIGSDPAKYGFTDPPEERYPNLQVVELPSPIRLSDVAKVTEISEDLLKKVNPHLLRGVTPPGAATYELWIPEEKVEVVKASTEKLASMKAQGLRRAYASEDSRHWYRVRRGDNLSMIASRHRVSVSYLKRINGLRSNRIYAGQRLRVSANSYHPSRTARYRVRRGDSLYSIAKRFGMSIQDLKELNSLRKNTIYVGQTLRVAANDG